MSKLWEQWAASVDIPPVPGRSPGRAARRMAGIRRVLVVLGQLADDGGVCQIGRARLGAHVDEGVHYPHQLSSQGLEDALQHLRESGLILVQPASLVARNKANTYLLRDPAAASTAGVRRG